jgi:hypothetical protein
VELLACLFKRHFASQLIGLQLHVNTTQILLVTNSRQKVPQFLGIVQADRGSSWDVFQVLQKLNEPKAKG